MRTINLPSDKSSGCPDCHSQFDVSEVQDQKEDPQEPKKNKPRYSLDEVMIPIFLQFTLQTYWSLKEAKSLFPL